MSFFNLCGCRIPYVRWLHEDGVVTAGTYVPIMRCVAKTFACEVCVVNLKTGCFYSFTKWILIQTMFQYTVINIYSTHHYHTCKHTIWTVGDSAVTLVRKNCHVNRTRSTSLPIDGLVLISEIFTGTQHYLLFYSFVTRSQTRKFLHELTVVGLEIRPPIYYTKTLPFQHLEQLLRWCSSQSFVSDNGYPTNPR